MTGFLAVFAAGSDTYPTTTSGFTVTQSIFDYARWERYAQSKISVNKAEVEFKLAKQQLLLRLAESYFLVLERADQLETVFDPFSTTTDDCLGTGLGLFTSLQIALESGGAISVESDRDHTTFRLIFPDRTPA